MIRSRTIVLGWMLSGVAQVWADEGHRVPPPASDSPSEAGAEMSPVEPPKPLTGPADVKFVVPPSARPRADAGSADSGSLRGVKLLSAKNGEARVLFQGAEVVVKAGDVLGEDVVKQVNEDLIVLDRKPGPARSAALVLIRLESGRTRVRVLSLQDLTAKNPRMSR